MRESLTKREIVRKKSEIDRIFKTGKHKHVRGLKLVLSENSLPYSRVIVIPVRHYGTAVERNKVRRRIKEIWRTSKTRLASGYDYAFVVYPGNGYDYAELKRILLSLCRKQGVLSDS